MPRCCLPPPGHTSSVRTSRRPCNSTSGPLQAEPGAPAILRHIVVLAFNLDRRAEAARYAQLLESHDPDDAVLLRRLGLELADEDDLQGSTGPLPARGGRRNRDKPTRQQRAVVDGDGPAVLLDPAIRPGGRAVRKNRARPGQPGRVRPERRTAQSHRRQGRFDLSVVRRMFSRSRPSSTRPKRRSRSPTNTKPTPACWPTIWPASPPACISRPKR